MIRSVRDQLAKGEQADVGDCECAGGEGRAGKVDGIVAGLGN
jgi:hypothetical protein